MGPQRVLILILLEVPFWGPDWRRRGTCPGVLILILLEVPFWDDLLCPPLYNTIEVLILILPGHGGWKYHSGNPMNYPHDFKTF
jgi:hypothetical protein